ncbi:MAG: tetratricopeptide repeat protein [Bdellovibrionales bacterium]|jgi:tetratricopeptide (TPR) repeat protein|nr:tetratricopeptide repeat protein [Bdellovibrionales bacterium]
MLDKDYLRNQSCLIVDSSAAFAANLRSCLQSMGFTTGQILIAAKPAAAKQLLLERKPTILITEQELDSIYSLHLMEIHESMHDESVRVSIMTGKSGTVAPIVNVSEGLLDGYLIKPFSLDAFRQQIKRILESKINPSEYALRLRAGRKLREQGLLDEALDEFGAAKLLHPKPSIAYYYVGQCLLQKQEYDLALEQFRHGLELNPTCYQCAFSEFETLFSLGRFEDVRKWIEPLRTRFPVTSYRLTMLYKVVIATEAFGELAALNDIYKDLDERSPELTSIALEASFIAGQTSLRRAHLAEALPFFEHGLILANRELAYIDRVAMALIEAGAHEDAKAFLDKSSPLDQGTPGFHRLSFRIAQATLPKDKLISIGREIVLSGHGEPDIFRSVVQLVAESGREILAETLIAKAVETAPDMRSELYGVLERILRTSA